MVLLLAANHFSLITAWCKKHFLRQAQSCRIMRSGFTLIEVIVSMTIMAMIALMLYWSFAMGARVWETQDIKTSTVQRRDVLARMLSEDFHRIAAYDLQWEKGTTRFFGVGPTAIFYVTRNGFGALDRNGKRLFFTSLFLREDGDNGLELALYKVPVLEPLLLQELHDFQTMGQFARGRFAPGREMTDQAVVILEGLESAEFTVVQEPFAPFAGVATDGLSDVEPEQTEEWVQEGFPGQVVLRYTLEGRETELRVIPFLGAP